MNAANRCFDSGREERVAERQIIHTSKQLERPEEKLNKASINKQTEEGHNKLASDCVG